MNKIIFKAALLVAISFVVVTQIMAQSSTKNTFTLKISNVKNVGSTIHIGFYKKENEFPTQKKHAFAKEFIPSTTGEVSVSWNDIPEGDYALAVYQDLDSNGVLKTNMFGYPKEPFCFSRNFIPKLSKPKFEQCFFSFNALYNTFSVELIN